MSIRMQSSTAEDRNDMWRSIKCAGVATKAIEVECLVIEKLIYQSFQNDGRLEIDEKRIESLEAMIEDLLHFVEEFKKQNDSYISHMQE